jgi:hypothetical protein
MITKEQLEKLSKDELILYNTLLEKDIKEVAYFACCKVQQNKDQNKTINRLWGKNVELKQKLSRFIGWNK